MSPIKPEFWRSSDSFPRVSGDEPMTEAQREAIAKFSPRERG